MLFNILQDATNGDKVVSYLLDQCVQATTDDENSPDYAIEVDLNNIGQRHRVANSKVIVNSSVVRDLINFKKEAAQKLLCHPVIETYCHIKWSSMHLFFLSNFLVYFIFLCSLSLYLGTIFYRHDQTAVTFPGGRGEFDELLWAPRLADPEKALIKPSSGQDGVFVNPKIFFETFKPEKPDFWWLTGSLYSTCGQSGAEAIYFCSLEIVLSICLVLLMLQEIVQLGAFGVRQYLGELENYIELLVIALSAACLYLKNNKPSSGDQEGRFDGLKLVSAFAIVLAYMELVFLLGRYPPLGGRISIMFYNITRRLIKSMSNLIILIFGFAFALFIIHNDAKGENFENPQKAIIKTLMMVLGEYEFDDFYKTKFPDKFSKIMAAVLLVFLAIIGSLVMVNLFIAIIVSDIDNLKKSGHLQEVVNRAQHLVHYETFLALLTFGCCSECKGADKDKNKIKVCVHSICSCRSKKLATTLTERLREILKKRQIVNELRENPKNNHDLVRAAGLNTSKQAVGSLLGRAVSKTSVEVFNDAVRDVVIYK